MMPGLMDRLIEFATTWLELVLLATWRTLPILVLAAGIGLAFRRRLTPSLHAMFLTIVVVRLLLPVSIGSPLSLHNPIDRWVSSDRDEAVSREALKTSRENAYGLLRQADRADLQKEWVQTAVHSSTTPTAWRDTLWAAIVVAGVSISIGLLLRSVLSHLRFAMKLRSCRLLDDQSLIDLLLRECDLLSVGRRPLLREVSSLSAPAVFGLFRQTICLPSGFISKLSEQELRWVIRHELAHIRRRDISVATMASLVCAFHWFNPVVWLIVRRLRAAMEAAADRLVLQKLTHSDVAAYGSLLLRIAETRVSAKSSPTLGLISFASGKDLKQRIKLLMGAPQKNGMGSRWLCSGVVATVALVSLTDSKEADEELPVLHLITNDPIAPPPQPLWNDPFVQASDGPTFVKKYDLEPIFDSMPNSLTDSAKSAQERFASWIPLSPSLDGKLHVQGHTLSAVLTARQHQLLRQTLDIWKDGEPKQISIEIRFIHTSTQTASSIDWAAQNISELTVRGAGPALAARIQEPELAELIRSVSAERDGTILFAPKVTLFDGQTAGVADQVQRPFTTGIVPRAGGGMQPVVSTVDEGLRLMLTPRTLEDESVSLAFEVRASSVGKVSYANLPIKSADADTRFTVEVPATEEYEVSSLATLAAGESVAVAIPRVFSYEPGADAETTLIVVLTPRIVVVQQSSVAFEAHR